MKSELGETRSSAHLDSHLVETGNVDKNRSLFDSGGINVQVICLADDLYLYEDDDQVDNGILSLVHTT